MAKDTANPAKKKVGEKTVFIWSGTDKRGNKTRGEMNAVSAAFVKATLRQQGILANSVKKKPKPLFGEKKKAIKPADIASFTRQLSTMVKAGVPLIQSFDIVAEGTDHPSLRDLIKEVRDDVSGGTGFGLALRKHPLYFDELFCNLVEAGEQSGALETMLDRVATYKEKTEQLKAKVKKAMKYPIAVVCVAVVVTALLLIKVVPQFAETFSSFGAELPVFTLFVISISEFMQAWWFIIAVMIGISLAVFKHLKQTNKAFKDGLDRVTLKLPIVGEIVDKSSIARFARTLSTTFAAGVPLVDSLESVAGATGNVVHRNAINSIREDVTTGQQLNFAVKNSGVFPSMVVQMVAIGEESGALDEMLAKVASHYEEEVDNMVDGLSSLMEPIIMSVLGVLVGGLMIAMYLPIFQIGQVVG